MEPKTKIGIIGLVVIVLVVVGVGICWMVGKNTVPSLKKAVLKESKKEIFTKVAEGESVKKLEPKLVWEKEFDSEIVDFVVPRMAGIRKGNEFPIVAVETEKEVLFLNKKGSISEKIPATGKMTIVSENGKYVLLSTLEDEDFEFEWDINSWEYLTQKGKKLWKIDEIYGCLNISPDGDVVVVCKPDNGIWFYNKSGKIMAFHDNIRFEQESLFSTFSANGKYYAFSFRNKLKDKSEYGFILFDKYGRILWRRSFDDSINKLLFSQDGKVIFIECGWKEKYRYSYVYLFDKMGRLLWQKTNDSPQDYLFSPKGDILVIKKKESISLIDTFSGKEFKSLKFEGANSIEVTSISSGSGVISILVKPEMYLINRRGEIIFKKKFKDSVFEHHCIKKNIYVIFPSDNKCFIVIKEIKKLLLYELTF